MLTADQVTFRKTTQHHVEVRGKESETRIKMKRKKSSQDEAKKSKIAKLDEFSIET